MPSENEHLGVVTGPDGRQYSLHYYGEHDELGFAVINGPTPPDDAEPMIVFEVYRAPAVDPSDAHAKLHAWRRAQGWPV